MKKKILIYFLAFTLIFCIIYIAATYEKSPKPVYRLSSYKNAVALYENEKVIEIYNSIVLNTLPENDKRRFEKGIIIATKEDATKIIEDYDG